MSAGAGRRPGTAAPQQLTSAPASAPDEPAGDRPSRSALRDNVRSLRRRADAEVCGGSRQVRLRPQLIDQAIPQQPRRWVRAMAGRRARQQSRQRVRTCQKTARRDLRLLRRTATPWQQSSHPPSRTALTRHQAVAEPCVFLVGLCVALDVRPWVCPDGDQDRAGDQAGPTKAVPTICRQRRVPVPSRLDAPLSTTKSKPCELPGRGDAPSCIKDPRQQHIVNRVRREMPGHPPPPGEFAEIPAHRTRCSARPGPQGAGSATAASRGLPGWPSRMRSARHHSLCRSRQTARSTPDRLSGRGEVWFSTNEGPPSP